MTFATICYLLSYLYEQGAHPTTKHPQESIIKTFSKYMERIPNGAETNDATLPMSH